VSPDVRIPTRTSPADGRAGAHCRGVTLIELVVVMVVVAILASIALPGYGRYVLRAHRSEAKAALLAIAAAQEQFHLQNHRYASLLAAAPPEGLGIPEGTPNGRYVMELEAQADAESFTATASAVGPQARDAPCRTLAIDQSGARSATHADCWR
jgi:type IV pilus assembly protein PilE